MWLFGVFIGVERRIVFLRCIRYLLSDGEIADFAHLGGVEAENDLIF